MMINGLLEYKILLVLCRFNTDMTTPGFLNQQLSRPFGCGGVYNVLNRLKKKRLVEDLIHDDQRYWVITDAGVNEVRIMNETINKIRGK